MGFRNNFFRGQEKIIGFSGEGGPEKGIKTFKSKKAPDTHSEKPTQKERKKERKKEKMKDRKQTMISSC